MATKRETEMPKEAEYTVEEFTENAAAVFGEAVSPDIVKTALRLAGVKTTTKSAATKIINEFRKKEVN
jgi:hypothetical protein